LYYTIYKTTNILNDKYYIGKHQTENTNDSYYGSGKALENAIKLHGKENFKKEILFIFDNESEMNKKEKEIITEDFIKSKRNYNIGIGGEGGPHFKGKKHSDETKNKLKESSIGKIFSDESKKKISESLKCRIVSEETRKKLSDSAKKRFESEEERNKISNKLKNHFVSDESKKKMSDSYKTVNKSKISDETKIKISESLKLYHRNRKN